MRIDRTTTSSFVLGLAIVLLPSGAFALTSAESLCRATIARSVGRYESSVSKVMIGCHQRRSQGARPLSDDCNDADQADALGVLPSLRAQVVATIVTACSGADSLLANYSGCPAPAASADDGGATGGIDDFGEVGDCLVALVDARAGQLSAAAQGDPPAAILDPLRKCQGKLGKGTSRILQTYQRERGRCQKAKDYAGVAGAYSCEDADPRGRIAKARARFQSKVGAACSFSPEVIQKLAACSGDSAGLLSCAGAAADLHGGALARAAYVLDGDTTASTTTTTTTTMPGATTTTLPGTACGETFPTCGGTCPAGSTCTAGPSSCTCVASGDGPCAPATIIRTIHAKYGGSPSRTGLSTGWSGNAHDVDIPDQTGDVVDVTCDDHCENCAITMNVQAGNPASNCRCTSDSTKTCTAINGTDAAACGSLDPTCRCYFGAPLPLSSGGTPACVVNRIREDYSGTMNLRTGEWHDHIRLASVVYLGLQVTQPCPVCVGDPVPNDGVRGGTCSGGIGSNACDANGIHAAFGATSFDCLPATAANISGTGLLIDLNSSTGSLSMSANLPCDTPGGASCPCRTCSGNGNLGCSSDAECAAAGAGTCTAGGGAGVKLNECENFDCLASGQCRTGPVDTYCDGAVYPDGRGYIPCSSDTDCSSSNAGTCSLPDVRRCFPDPITTTGTPDTYEPTDGALFCIAPTSNPAVNLAAGLPGPGKFLLSFNSDIRCQSDPSLVYEFPSGANCGDGSGTTTTTLLPLPDCADAVAPVCGGLCPLGQTCTASGGTCSCTGVPLPSCDTATSPVCGGFCADTSMLCMDDGSGGCSCQIPTLPQCAGATAPVCGGLCPTGEVCTDVGGGCECGAPGLPACGTALSPTCAGLCDVGQVCVDQGGTCGCLDSGLPTCAEATTPLCAGTCGVGSLCQAVGDACQCVGLPLP